MSISTIRQLLLLICLATPGYATLTAEMVQKADYDDPSKRYEFFADALVWNLQETCNQWAFIINPKFVSPPAFPFTGTFNAVLKPVTFDWNPGIRAGFSYTLPHDQWDTRLYYTWFHTSGSSKIIPPPGEVIQSQFIATDFLLTLPGFSASFFQASINWKVFFSMFNWDIGRIYKFSHLSLRPHLGVEGGWIDQTIHANWINSFTITPYNAPEVLKHKFWGVGPEVGANSKWTLGSVSNHSFSLFGDFSQVFMWGHWSFNEVAHTTINVITINTQPDREMGSLTFQSIAGFAWDYSDHKNPVNLAVKLGYEFQVWMQQLQFFQHFSGILNNALTIQGFTGRLQLKY